MTISYRVVYPKGDRNKLTVVQVVDYEVDEWDIASRHEYQDEEDAWLQAEYLAGHFNKELVGRNLPVYLD